MADILTLQRFQELADAYGGVVDRWPERYRDGASRMASRPEARAILSDAMGFDKILDAWSVAPPRNGLRDRIFANAPLPSRKVISRMSLWWSGVGIATALAGAAVGTAAVAMTTHTEVVSDSDSSFGDIAGQED